MTFFWQSLTLFEILKQRRKHPRFVCFLSPDFYLLFWKSQTIVSFSQWSQVFVWPTLQVTPPPPPALCVLHLLHPLGLHTCSVRSAGWNFQIWVKFRLRHGEREILWQLYCLPMQVLTLSKLYATEVRIFGQSHASYIKIRYILSLEGVLVH